MSDSPKLLFFDPNDAPPRHSSVPSDEMLAHGDAARTLSMLVEIIFSCGQDPITQLAGYLMTDDPTYLPDSSHARAIADHIGRDKLLETLIELYLDGNGSAAAPRELGR